jgi:hypothetical protein
MRCIRRASSIVVGALELLTALLVTGCGAVSSEPRALDRKARNEVPSAKTTDPKGQSAKDSRSDETKSLGFVAAALGASAAELAKGTCRPGMVNIEGRFCIDRYEASLVEVLPNGEERPFSPFTTITDQHVRAVSVPDVYPQGYISATQAERACAASGKRLCKISEWQQACRGPEGKKYGYGDKREPGRCNDKGRNPVVTLFGFRYDASTMNQPQLNQLPGTLAKTGEHPDCSNEYGVYDMVGNLHEWVADPNGTFYGGYYQDVASVGHGEGCGYQTTAHEARYHDYSTGFRCCADLLGTEKAVVIDPPTDPPPVRAKPVTARPKFKMKVRGPKKRRN